MNPRELFLYNYPNPPAPPTACEGYCKTLPESPESCPEYCRGFSDPPPPSTLQTPNHKHFVLPIFLTVAIVILATAFFFFTCFTVYRFYTCWRRSGRRQPALEDGPEEFLDEDQGPVVDHPIWYIRTVGLDAAVIEAISIVRYKRGEGLIDGTDCSVCLSEFQEDETLRLLPKCNHAFHLPCIDTWLRSHTNCPMCRARIVANDTPEPAPAVQNPEEIQITVSPVETEAEPPGGELDGSDEFQQQPVRRSLSLDSMSAFAIHTAVRRQLDRDSDKHLIEEKGEIETIQTGPSAVKRSVSCSAKVFLARHSSRSRNWV